MVFTRLSSILHRRSALRRATQQFLRQSTNTFSNRQQQARESLASEGVLSPASTRCDAAGDGGDGTGSEIPDLPNTRPLGPPSPNAPNPVSEPNLSCPMIYDDFLTSAPAGLVSRRSRGLRGDETSGTPSIRFFKDRSASTCSFSFAVMLVVTQA
ncbi:hypothetical protein GN244_ATG18885 [Phytophthora infestans]|uniref:Uncharacterized protein n=1 Tax=Phytophthora infestans TaxID=4787 RepID=A0A833S604_PHYIN|nr:hypothetical protein GN244_ATG18885 [Phytophthora infestans]